MFVVLRGLHLLIHFAVIISILRIIEAVKCAHCGNDFISLGRHTWRCKARVTSAAYPGNILSSPPMTRPTSGIPQPGIPLIPPNTATNDVLCVCGRTCKGRRGLTAHQRSCEFYKRLTRGDLLSHLPSDSATPPDVTPPPDDNDHLPRSPPPQHSEVNIKPGVRLPKTKLQWAEANAYFHIQFASIISSPTVDLNSDIQRAQNVVYDYFSNVYGTIPIETNTDYSTKYSDHSIKNLKQVLMRLKKAQSQANSDVSELRYVSSLIRTRLVGQDRIDKNDGDGAELEKSLKLKFWSTCHELFKKAENLLPTFDLCQCYNYFKDTVSQTIHTQCSSVSIYPTGYRN